MMPFHVAKGNSESDSVAWGLVVICMPPSKTPVLLPLVEWMTSFDKSSSIMSGGLGRGRDSSRTEVDSKAAVLGMPAQSHSTSSDDCYSHCHLAVLLRTRSGRSLRTTHAS